jgi:D-alanine transaminase
MNHVLLNDELLSRDKGIVDIEDRGYQFGDGIYEVFGVYNGKTFLLDEHLRRLVRSADELRLRLPYDMETLKKKLIELYRADAVLNGIVYVQVSRGVAPRDHAFPDASVPCRLIAYTMKKERPLELQASGTGAILSEDIRWLRCDIKSLNLLGNVLAKQKAREQQAFEAILHRDSTVTEGSATNVFIVKDGTVMTHPANNLILNGITRSKVLELCRKNDIPSQEISFSINQLMSADEVFITGTFIDIVPIVQLEGRNISNGVVGKITSGLQTHMNKLIAEL